MILYGYSHSTQGARDMADSYAWAASLSLLEAIFGLLIAATWKVAVDIRSAC